MKFSQATTSRQKRHILAALILSSITMASDCTPPQLQIAEGSLWHMFEGTQEPEQGWNGLNFDDSTWEERPSGIGYNTLCNPTTFIDDMQNTYSTLYIRHQVEITDPSVYSNPVLTLDYDDGFVAYVNGVEIARNNVEGTPPTYNELASAQHACSGKSGGATTPEHFEFDQALLVVGTNVFAIEGHNTSVGSSDFLLSPVLTSRSNIGEVESADYAWHGPEEDDTFGLANGYDTSPLHEASGLVQSRQNEGVFWSHNDNGGDERLFAVHSSGTYLGTWNVEGVSANDLEDIAIGPDPQDPTSGDYYLYVGDIGDGDNVRGAIQVWRVLEPRVEVNDDDSPTGGFTENTITATSFTLHYPATYTAHKNAETLMIDPSNSDIYIASKFTSPVKIWRSAYDPTTDTYESTLELVAEVPNEGQSTGGNISEDGHLIVIRTYKSGRIWERLPGMTVAEAFAQTPIYVGGLTEFQGEAITFDVNNSGRFYTISEDKTGAHGFVPIYLYEAR